MQQFHNEPNFNHLLQQLAWTIYWIIAQAKEGILPVATDREGVANVTQ